MYSKDTYVGVYVLATAGSMTELRGEILKHDTGPKSISSLHVSTYVFSEVSTVYVILVYFDFSTINEFGNVVVKAIALGPCFLMLYKSPICSEPVGLRPMAYFWRMTRD